MLNCFEIFLPILRRNLELLERVGYDFVQRQWEQNVIYTEVRYSPFLLAEEFNSTRTRKGSVAATDDESNRCTTDRNVTAEDVFGAVTRGLRRGCAAFGVTVNQIVCAITWRPDWAWPSLELAHRHRSSHPCAVVGIDIAAGEEHFDPVRFPDLHRPHYDMIQGARLLGIPVTMHAGESTELAADNVRRSIVEYGASRIGHGYRMLQDSGLVELVRNSKVHVEVCPTSSYETGGWITARGKKDWSGHPAVAMKAAGVSFSLSSDDPAVFHTSLAWQYRIALAKMNLTRKDLVESNLSAVDAAFCSQEEKDRLRGVLRAFAEQQRLTVPLPSSSAMHPSQSETNLLLFFDPHRRTRRVSYRTWARSKSESFSDRVYLSSSFKM
jgi:adenosine deaminase